MTNRTAPADLPAPDFECGQDFIPAYAADTVRKLLTDERRKALEEALKLVRDFTGRDPWTAPLRSQIRALIQP